MAIDNISSGSSGSFDQIDLGGGGFGTDSSVDFTDTSWDSGWDFNDWDWELGDTSFDTGDFGSDYSFDTGDYTTDFSLSNPWEDTSNFNQPSSDYWQGGGLLNEPGGDMLTKTDFFGGKNKEYDKTADLLGSDATAGKTSSEMAAEGVGGIDRAAAEKMLEEAFKSGDIAKIRAAQLALSYVDQKEKSAGGEKDWWEKLLDNKTALSLGVGLLQGGLGMYQQQKKEDAAREAEDRDFERRKEWEMFKKDLYARPAGGGGAATAITPYVKKSRQGKFTKRK